METTSPLEDCPWLGNDPVLKDMPWRAHSARVRRVEKPGEKGEPGKPWLQFIDVPFHEDYPLHNAHLQRIL